MCGEYLPSGRYASLRNRFTPTCVGNTKAPPPHPRNSTVHPHVCGEYELGRVCQPVDYGSPPRVWGILTNISIMVYLLSVHPHVCGEYLIKNIRQNRHGGSPPRVWGILVKVPPPWKAWTVHPHVCGEYSAGIPSQPPHNGSPPRVWGILRRRSSLPSQHPVHPHVCGEYWVCRYRRQLSRRFTPTCVGNTVRAILIFIFFSGSPPRVWGIRRLDKIGRHAIRFTPTCVGNTWSCMTGMVSRNGSPPRVWGILNMLWVVSFVQPVHPHVCGEYQVG